MKEKMKSRKKVIIAIFAIVLSVSYLRASIADIITLKQGGEIKGRIVEEKEEGIKFELKSGIIFIKKEDIATITKREITDDLIITKNGVEDQWGSLVPPSPFELMMSPPQPNTLKDEESNSFYSLAQKHEIKAKNESLPELRQARLMMALIYYRVAVNSSKETIKNSSQSGIERCSAQLFNPRKEEIVIPFGSNMIEHIEFFIEKLNNEKEKEKYVNIYLGLGQDYEDKLNIKELSPEERFRNLQIATNCYYIVRDHSSDEKTKLIANKALSELQPKLEELKDPKAKLIKSKK